jgi:hypothetical protein
MHERSATDSSLLNDPLPATTLFPNLGLQNDTSYTCCVIGLASPVGGSFSGDGGLNETTSPNLVESATSVPSVRCLVTFPRSVHVNSATHKIIKLYEVLLGVLSI